ncbi:DNA-methyltransferase [Burkholderia stagnalis]|uniref:DNA-methyltransferase n=1 Tax=Burkholderia stagnalis TaxID=1503054 RepID=UPI0009BDFD68|nr:site-specific DNA-methyltransferase [Burkholderia stagnalis]HDR9165746.1 site-specific DNA-methyltransferase [Burkholderia vietnamiensis]
MTRLPESSLDTIIHGDCIAGIRQLPAESVDLIVADPPYNLNKDFGAWKESERKEEWLSWSKTWLNECERVLRPGGSIFVYGIHHHLCWIQCHLYELGLEYRRQIIWYYENGFAGYTRTLAAHYEPLLWFSKGNDYVYHPIREPYKSTERLKHAITKNGKVWKPHPDGRLAGDVWQFPVLAGRRFKDEKVAHPTQKPLSISSRIVRHFSNVGDVVLVPFAGSGSECVAAKEASRHYVGFELNADYIQIAADRLAKCHRVDANSQSVAHETMVSTGCDGLVSLA